jgi:hypothetical protein
MGAPRRGVTPGFVEGDLVCRMGNKRCYFGPQEAESARSYRQSITGTPLFVYRCHVCGYLHLTSKVQVET